MDEQDVPFVVVSECNDNNKEKESGPKVMEDHAMLSANKTQGINDSEEKKGPESEKVEEHAIASAIARNTTEDRPQKLKRRKFEGMLILTEVEHNNSKHVANRTRKQTKPHSQFKNPKIGTTSKPIRFDNSDLESD